MKRDSPVPFALHGAVRCFFVYRKTFCRSQQVSRKDRLQTFLCIESRSVQMFMDDLLDKILSLFNARQFNQLAIILDFVVCEDH